MNCRAHWWKWYRYDTDAIRAPRQTRHWLTVHWEEDHSTDQPSHRHLGGDYRFIPGVICACGSRLGLWGGCQGIRSPARPCPFTMHTLMWNNYGTWQAPVVYILHRFSPLIINCLIRNHLFIAAHFLWCRYMYPRPRRRSWWIMLPKWKHLKYIY